jgi:hypothetical protein
MKPRSKYGAKSVTIDGIRFASRLEGNRYGELKLLERAGEISLLLPQYRFPLMAPNNEVVGFYVADFFYEEDGKRVCEEAKGFWTDLAKWKVKHFKAQYPYIEFREVRSSGLRRAA